MLLTAVVGVAWAGIRVIKQIKAILIFTYHVRKRIHMELLFMVSFAELGGEYI